MIVPLLYAEGDRSRVVKKRRDGRTDERRGKNNLWGRGEEREKREEDGEKPEREELEKNLSYRTEISAGFEY